jgi:hypothetical protein
MAQKSGKYITASVLEASGKSSHLAPVLQASAQLSQLTVVAHSPLLLIPLQLQLQLRLLLH